jgi:transcriptional accessory protein Tex/SPT6
VTDFGAFVDIGVHEDGLVHISRAFRTGMSAHPSVVVKVGGTSSTSPCSAGGEKKRILPVHEETDRQNNDQKEKKHGPFVTRRALPRSTPDMFTLRWRPGYLLAAAEKLL